MYAAFGPGVSCACGLQLSVASEPPALPSSPPASPTELLADDVLSPAADSWAFGTLLWELLSGRRAWRGMG